MELSIGYQITNSAVEEKKALAQAFAILRKAKHLGLETRDWAKQTHWECHSILTRIKKDIGMNSAMKLWHIACMESKIAMALRNYMNQTAALINEVKPLNPPLRNEQVKPFIEAMTLDRNTPQ